MNRDLYALDRWIAQHPVQAWFWSAGFVVLIVVHGDSVSMGGGAMTPEEASAAIRRLVEAVISIMQGDMTGKALHEEAVAAIALFNALTGQAASDEQIKAMVKV